MPYITDRDFTRVCEIVDFLNADLARREDLAHLVDMSARLKKIFSKYEPKGEGEREAEDEEGEEGEHMEKASA